MILKEVISFYENNDSSVNCVFVFDRVEYGKLFHLLLERNIPPQIVWLLLNMYTNQHQVLLLYGMVYIH